MPERYEPIHRQVTAWNGAQFEVLWRYNTVDYDIYTSVMMEDGYRLQQLPIRLGTTAIDLGASNGAVSLMLASMGAKVYSVEPVPENIEIFNWNIKRNGYADQIKVYQRAIASSNRVIKTRYLDQNENPFFMMHHFISRTVDWQPHKNDKIIDVEGITLEGIFKENKIERCHVIKVDIEGAEWDAFKDVPDYILDRIDVILGEVHYKQWGEPVGNNSLMPLFRDKFVNASMEYDDDNPGHADCKIIGECSNFYYIRKGLPIPVKW